MALFMEEGSKPLTESEEADLVAIAAIKESSALELKEQGNNCVKMGKKHYADAIDCYTRAINQKALGDSDTSIVLSNRSHVNLLLGNYRRALTDAEEAIKLSPNNVKAIYRAAKATFHLNLLSEGASFCQIGLEKSPSNEDLKKLSIQVESRRNELEVHKAAVSNALSAAKALVYAIDIRGLKLGKAMYQELTGVKKPTLDADNILHWPVLLLYAEVMSSDFIEDFYESDMFSAHLDMMYSDSCESLPWDTGCNYTRDAIELYYQANSGVSLSKKETLRHFLEGTAGALVEDIQDEENDVRSNSGNIISSKGPGKWIKVDERKSLSNILQQRDYIIPGIPAFYILSNKSEFYRKFKAGKWSPP